MVPESGNKKQQVCILLFNSKAFLSSHLMHTLKLSGWIEASILCFVPYDTTLSLNINIIAYNKIILNDTKLHL